MNTLAEILANPKTAQDKIERIDRVIQESTIDPILKRDHLFVKNMLNQISQHIDNLCKYDTGVNEVDELYKIQNDLMTLITSNNINKQSSKNLK